MTAGGADKFAQPSKAWQISCAMRSELCSSSSTCAAATTSWPEQSQITTPLCSQCHDAMMQDVTAHQWSPHQRLCKLSCLSRSPTLHPIIPPCCISMFTHNLGSAGAELATACQCRLAWHQQRLPWVRSISAWAALCHPAVRWPRSPPPETPETAPPNTQGLIQFDALCIGATIWHQIICAFYDDNQSTCSAPVAASSSSSSDDQSV